jgi:hypothetical protein
MDSSRFNYCTADCSVCVNLAILLFEALPAMVYHSSKKTYLHYIRIIISLVWKILVSMVLDSCIRSRHERLNYTDPFLALKFHLEFPNQIHPINFITM